MENGRRTKVTGKGKKKKTTGWRFLLSLSFQKVISDSGTITFFRTFQRSTSKTKGVQNKNPLLHFPLFLVLLFPAMAVAPPPPPTENKTDSCTSVSQHAAETFLFAAPDLLDKIYRRSDVFPL